MMSVTRRRLSLQLTPLLDLLLIVIFAQYMEVQQNTQASQRDLAQQRAELASASEQYQQRLASLQTVQDQAGDRLAAALDLPGSVLNQVTRWRQSDQPEDAERLRQAGARIQRQLAARGAELFEFVIRYDEMQKHVSFWELYLASNGQAWLSDGQQSQRVTFATSNEFVQQALAASKSLAEPRTMVLIVISYADTQARVRQIAVESMPALTQELRRDAGLTRWYDYSLLGYRPRGPLMAELETSVPPSTRPAGEPGNAAEIDAQQSIAPLDR